MIALIAMESSSGWVPDNVNFMKTWALLNIRSSHQAVGKQLSPFEDWKNSERPLLDQQNINGSVDEQMEKLLIIYEKYSSGESAMTTDKFSEIVASVIEAGRSWYTYGRNSVADPVHGATSWKDASGLYYPNGGMDKTDKHLHDYPNYEKILTQYDTMVNFKSKFANNLAVSQVYQFAWYPGNPMERQYTFTVFFVGDY